MMLQEDLGGDGRQMALCDDVEVKKSNRVSVLAHSCRFVGLCFSLERRQTLSCSCSRGDANDTYDKYKADKLTETQRDKQESAQRREHTTNRAEKSRLS